MGDKKFRDFQTLSAEIQSFSEGLSKGDLSLDQLERFEEASRELFELSIILKYRAYQRLTESAEPEKQEAEIETQIPSQQTDPEVVKEPEPSKPIEKTFTAEEGNVAEEPEVDIPSGTPFRIGKNGSIPGPNQISLIDSIEEITRAEETLNQKLSSQKKPSRTLANQLAKKPVKNLKKGIPIHQRFLFINELFQQDASAFEEAVEYIDECNDYSKAKSYVENKLSSNYKWDEENPHVRAFEDLVERRFL